MLPPTHRSWKRLVIASSLALLSACSGGDDDATGLGPGNAGSGAGGTSGASGSSGASGAAGSAGQAGSGGTIQTAGSGGATAGTCGACGSGAVGGVGGTGGAADDAGMTEEGCLVGGVLYPYGAGGIPHEDGCNTCACAESGLACTRIACQPDRLDDAECVVAKRIDECCEPWVAVEHRQAKEDPCLVAVGEPRPRGQQLLGCAPPVAECAMLACSDTSEPPTRATLKVDGTCMFADECLTAADCVLARDVTSCCACPESMPAQLVEQLFCLAAEGEDVDRSMCADVLECAAVRCGPCEPATEATCAMGDALNRCR